MGICNSIRISPYKFSLYEEVSIRERELRKILHEYKIYDWEEVMEMMMLSVMAEMVYCNSGLSSYIWREMRRKHRLENIIWRNEYRELEKMYEKLMHRVDIDVDIEKDCFERTNWKMGVRRKVIMQIANYNFFYRKTWKKWDNI